MIESNSIPETARLEEGRLTGPTIRKGKSNQIVGTPECFISAVEKRFGAIAWDLAAVASNSVCGAASARYFGPDHFREDDRDSLAKDWSKVAEGTLWCNPPFADIAPWAAKLATVKDRIGWTLMLVPASVGSSWFADHVHGKCLTLGLSPRLTFVGSTDPYPKDLALICAGYGVNGFDTWRWK